MGCYIAGLIAQILYNSTHAENPSRRRLFLKTLAFGLMKNQLEGRVKSSNLPTDIKWFLTKYRKRSREDNEEADAAQHPPLKIRSRRVLCGRAKNNHFKMFSV